MAEESVSFPDDTQDEALDDLYQPLKLELQDRKVVLGEEEYLIRAEIEADLFEIEADKMASMSSLRWMTENVLPLMLNDMDAQIVKAQIASKQVRPVDVLKKFGPSVRKLVGIIEARTKAIQKKRRELPK